MLDGASGTSINMAKRNRTVWIDSEIGVRYGFPHVFMGVVEQRRPSLIR